MQEGGAYQDEFDAQVHNIAKLTVDYLNDDAIVGALGSRRPEEKSIGKLDRFLAKHH